MRSTEQHRSGSRAASRRIRLPAVALLLLVAVWPAAAADEDVQLWLPVTWTNSIGDSVQGFFEVQPRIGEDISEVTQLVVRTALGYRVTPSWSAWVGYGWTPTFEPAEQMENRIFQQALFARDYSRLRLTSRTRLEQRWIEGVSGPSVRARTLLRGQFPFSTDRSWSIAAQDEIFVNLNTASNTAPRAGFDQNRIFLGINRVLHPSIGLDAGYMLQLVNTREPGFADRINHILLLQLYVNT